MLGKHLPRASPGRTVSLPLNKRRAPWILAIQEPMHLVTPEGTRARGHARSPGRACTILHDTLVTTHRFMDPIPPSCLSEVPPSLNAEMCLEPPISENSVEEHTASKSTKRNRRKVGPAEGRDSVTNPEAMETDHSTSANKEAEPESPTLNLAQTRKAGSPPVEEGARKKKKMFSGDKVTTTRGYIAPTPKFLMITREAEPESGNQDFGKVNPFLIARTLSKHVKGELQSVRKVSGGLLVETKTSLQTIQLLTLTRIGDLKVSVSPHGKLNNSQGVVVCSDLLNCTEDEIVQEMRGSGVIGCRRMTVMKDGARKPLPTHVLTFDRPTVPEHVIAGIHRLSVRHFVPSPMRCFRCQRFGHTASRCKREPICVCGRPTHEGNECGANPTCVNCNGAHSAKSRNCPMFKLETQIQEIKTTRHLSYAEAKRLVPQGNLVGGGQSYATVTASKPGAVQLPPQEVLMAQLQPMIERAISQVLNNLIPACRSAMENTSTSTKPRNGPAPTSSNAGTNPGPSTSGNSGGQLAKFFDSLAKGDRNVNSDTFKVPHPHPNPNPKPSQSPNPKPNPSDAGPKKGDRTTIPPTPPPKPTQPESSELSDASEYGCSGSEANSSQEIPGSKTKQKRRNRGRPKGYVKVDGKWVRTSPTSEIPPNGEVATVEQ